MNRYEFLSILKESLNNFPYEEREAALAYYNEFFDDAGVENEQAVIASLGDPKELAKTILKESGVNSEQNFENQNPVFTPPPTNKQTVNKSDNANAILIALLLIITSPVWFSTIFGLLIAFIATIFGLTIAFFVVSAVCLIFGIAQLFVSPATGILLIGIGMIALGLSILIVFPLLKWLFKVMCSAFKGIGNFFSNLFHRKETNV